MQPWGSQGAPGMAEQGRAQGRTQGYAGTWPPRDAARAGGIAPSGLSAWPLLIDKLRTWIRAEAGAGRLLPWVPVAFGTGIALYFTADREPVLSVVAVVAMGLCAAAFLLRRQRIFPIAVMIAAIAAGFAIATWKTARVAHGVLARPMYSVSLSGFVQTRDIRELPIASCCASRTWRARDRRSSWSAFGCRCARALHPQSAASLN